MIESADAPKPLGLYPHARQVGNLLFVSGLSARQRGKKEIPGVKLGDSGEVIDYDIEVQCRYLFENIRCILEEAGSSWEQLVDVTVFLIDIKRDFVQYNKIYAEYFVNCRPCRTTVEVSSLPLPDIAVEMKCIATI